MNHVALAALALGAAATSQAHPGPAAPPAYALPSTEVHRIPRPEPGAEQVLYVSLPREYSDGERRYPVVYLLDADYSFAIAHNVVEHLVDRGDLPPMILVGIAYPGQSQDIPTYRRHRTRDYTPTHTLVGGYGSEFQRLSGGGVAFRDFIAERVVPFVDTRYRTNGERCLVGHSYGGLFTTFVLLTRPGLFSRYLAASPSYWYDEGLVFRLEQQAVREDLELRGRVALMVGALESRPRIRYEMVGDLERFAALLQDRHPRLSLQTVVFPDETHNSVFPAALTRGLRWLFP